MPNALHPAGGQFGDQLIISPADGNDPKHVLVVDYKCLLCTYVYLWLTTLAPNCSSNKQAGATFCNLLGSWASYCMRPSSCSSKGNKLFLERNTTHLMEITMFRGHTHCSSTAQ